jgi:hypothetical protein
VYDRKLVDRNKEKKVVERFADIIVILGLKNQDFNGSIIILTFLLLEYKRLALQVVDSYPQLGPRGGQNGAEDPE